MKIILLPLILMSFGLNNNINNNQSDVFLPNGVNILQSSIELEESEEIISEPTEETENSVLTSFIDEFISPIIVGIASINIGAIFTFIVNLVVNVKKNKRNEENQRNTNKRIDELYDTLQLLFASLKENQTSTGLYNEILKKTGQKFNNGIEKLSKQHINIEDLENLILSIIVSVVKNDPKCVANGTTEKIIKLIEEYKGK